MFQRIKHELLLREKCNVIVVNWIGGAGPPYPQAVANTRLVGAMTARLASQLIEVGGVQARRIHAIGHSLGAHTCGYLGYHLRVQYGHTLGRITGEFAFGNTSNVLKNISRTKSYELTGHRINLATPSASGIER